MPGAGATPNPSLMAPMVTLERRGRVAVFTLDRPEARNAVNEELSTQMEQLLEEFEADAELSVAILRSSFDGVFCAGADLKAVGRGERLTSRKGGFCGLSFPRRKLLIGAIDGGEPPHPSSPPPPPASRLKALCADALAGGCELALGCDMLVASHRARFGVPEVTRSLVPTGGGVVLLPRVLPYASSWPMQAAAPGVGSTGWSDPEVSPV